MALTADPVFVVPAYGWERAAWFAAHILASDAAMSGLPLRWIAVDLNLPPELDDDALALLWDAFHRACEGLGIAVVTGHTARYDGCAWPMVGGATCMALGPDDGHLQLAISDDGRGLTAAPADVGRGISGMRERAAYSGGTLTVRAGATGGTVVTLRVPLEEPGS